MRWTRKGLSSTGLAANQAHTFETTITSVSFRRPESPVAWEDVCLLLSFLLHSAEINGEKKALGTPRYAGAVSRKLITQPVKGVLQEEPRLVIFRRGRMASAKPLERSLLPLYTHLGIEEASCCLIPRKLITDTQMLLPRFPPSWARFILFFLCTKPLLDNSLERKRRRRTGGRDSTAGLGKLVQGCCRFP